MDALLLVVSYAKAGSPKFETAAVKWLARLAVEGRDMRLTDVRLAAAALATTSASASIRLRRPISLAAISA